jgi:hypothetical protein
MDPAVRDMDPAVRDMDPAVQDMDPAVRDMDPAVRDTDLAVQDMDPAVRDTDLAVQDMDPAVQDTENLRGYPLKQLRLSGRFFEGNAEVVVGFFIRDATAGCATEKTLLEEVRFVDVFDRVAWLG